LKVLKNSQFLTSAELQERWQVKEIDLYALIKSKKIRCLTLADKYIDWNPIFLSIKDMGRLFFYKPYVLDFEEENPAYKPQDKSDPHESPSPYLDKKNQYYSKELSIAIETWFAIYGPDGKLNSAQKHKKQIVAYLKKFHPDISESAVERISTMINADVPGAPKTSY